MESILYLKKHNLAGPSIHGDRQTIKKPLIPMYPDAVDTRTNALLSTNVKSIKYKQ